jgi:Chondroitinase B
MESMVTEAPDLATEEKVAGPRDRITVEKIEREIGRRDFKDGRRYRRPEMKNGVLTIESYDFTTKRSGKQLRLVDKQDVVIQYCKFGRKRRSDEGQGLEITGSETRNITVQYCMFEDFEYMGTNGGEPLRLGNSPHSGIEFGCVVKNNIFRNCKQIDPEMISIKACNNRIEDNFFINNTTNVTVRHGGLNKIQHNYFRGNHGVRIHGTDNYVGYNCFADNDENGKLSPITVRWGSEDRDRHWRNNRPSGREGDSHNEKAPARDTKIEGNEFKNCRITIREFQDSDEDERPRGTERNNNREVDRFTFERRD